MLVCTLLLFQFLHSAAVQFIPSLKVHFIHPPQTRNGHTKKGTGFLIRLLGGTTAKWSQIGAALTFLSNAPSFMVHHVNGTTFLLYLCIHPFSSLLSQLVYADWYQSVVPTEDCSGVVVILTKLYGKISVQSQNVCIFVMNFQ